MAAKGRSEDELWEALEGLDDDLLDLDMPSDLVDHELRRLGVDPVALAERGSAFVASLMERDRLAWREGAIARKAELEARAATSTQSTDGLDRAGLLSRLEVLRAADPELGTVVKMAARKRLPEESTDDELRSLVEQMEALRALEKKEH